MINFIICDDDLKFRKKVETAVDKYMMKNHTEYKIYLFDDYDKSFLNIVNKSYLLKFIF